MRSPSAPNFEALTAFRKPEQMGHRMRAEGGIQRVEWLPGSEMGRARVLVCLLPVRFCRAAGIRLPLADTPPWTCLFHANAS